MRELLLGLDIGTSACKAAVFHSDGEVIATESKSFPVHHPQRGYAEQDPNDWWDAVSYCTRKMFAEKKVSPHEIAAIGIDGQSWAAVPVDKNGMCLCNSPLWMDTRAKDICNEVNNKIGAKNIFSISGNPLKPGYTTPKVIWYKKNLPEIYSRISKILQSNGYIAFMLTGELTQDISQGYGWHCFDMRKGTWSYDTARELGIDTRLLPDIFPCDKVIGGVTKSASSETGLIEGTPVVAGGLDAACGALGVGVIREGEAQEQGGQAGGMSICLKDYAAEENLILSFHVVPDKWLLQGGTTGGGGVIRWFTDQFCTGESKREIFAEINSLAEKIPAGSEGLIFLPYMSGERTPIWDTDAKGVFYGIDFSKTKGHFIRSCMEGTAYSLKHNLVTAERAGAYVDELRAMGGSANSHLWTQIKADVTGKTITVPSSDTATTFGAAILAGVGAGIYSGYDDAVNKTVKIKRTHEPNKNNEEVYARNYDTYRAIYESLKHIMKSHN